MQRSRIEDDDDDGEGGLELPHLKKQRTVELRSDSEDEWTPTYPLCLLGGRWLDEGPSDHRVEIWEKIWDDRLEKEVEKEKKRGQNSIAVGKDLGSSESGFREGTEEESDHYITNYIK